LQNCIVSPDDLKQASNKMESYLIEQGDVADILEHPNQKRYPGQRVLVVIVDEYAYLVPCIETEDEVFLKTIIPSRKATREYLGEK